MEKGRKRWFHCSHKQKVSFVKGCRCEKLSFPCTLSLENEVQTNKRNLPEWHSPGQIKQFSFFNQIIVYALFSPGPSINHLTHFSSYIPLKSAVKSARLLFWVCVKLFTFRHSDRLGTDSHNLKKKSTDWWLYRLCIYLFGMRNILIRRTSGVKQFSYM